MKSGLERMAAWTVSLVLGFSLLMGGAAQAGFVDSIGNSADRAGKGVERKTGQSSDNKNYKNWRMTENDMRVQLPIHYNMNSRSKSGFKAASKKEGISLVVEARPYKKQEAGGPSQAEAAKVAKEAKNSGKIYSYDEKSINGVRGVETVSLSDMKDRDSARSYKWEGWDPESSRHMVVIANFPPKKFDPNKYDFEGYHRFHSLEDVRNAQQVTLFI